LLGLPNQHPGNKDEYAAKHNPFVYFHSLLDSGSCNNNVGALGTPQNSPLVRALKSVETTPNYTWITALQFAGAPAGANNIVALPKPVAAAPRDTSSKAPPAAAKKTPALPTTIPKDDITIRLTGRTVDIQALTRFMRDLSQSPFLSDVSVERADPGSDQGKEMYQFTLSMRYRRPDTTAIHRIPLVVTVR